MLLTDSYSSASQVPAWVAMLLEKTAIVPSLKKDLKISLVHLHNTFLGLIHILAVFCEEATMVPLLDVFCQVCSHQFLGQRLEVEVADIS